MRVIRVHPAHRLSRLLLGVVVSVTLLATGSPVRALESSGFTYELVGGVATVTGCASTCPVNLVIPATLGGAEVTRIDHGAFSGLFLDSPLTSVTIPDSVTFIGDYAFWLNQLTSVTIPNSVTSIGSMAFRENLLTSVTISTGVTSISAEAFSDNLLTSVTIPTDVTSIGAQAFARNSLVTVTIPYWVGNIGDWAFWDNALTSVVFLGAAPAAGYGVFDGNDGLTAIKRTSASSRWGATWSDVPVVIASGFTYDVAGGTATVTGCIGPCPATIDIPAVLDGYSVTKIGDFALANKALGLDGLLGVTIPSSVTSIGESAFENNSLTTVTIPNSVTNIGDYAFYSNSLTTVTIPDSVTNIGGYAFHGNSLTTVTIGSSVTAVGDNAFAYNPLTSVTFLGNAPTAGSNVFEGISSLTSVTRTTTATGWGSTWGGKTVLVVNGFTYVVSSGSATVTGCVGTCSATLVIPATLGGFAVTSIGDRALDSESLTSVTIPNSVTSIGIYAFAYNWLTSVTIPPSVTSIGNGAFVSNTLTSVTIPNSVTSIGESAFAFNLLASVTIPPSVTSISTGAFNRNWLTSVTLPSTVTSIGSSAFRSNKLTSVTIPASVMTIEPGAFHDNQLTRVTFMGNAPEGTGSAVFDVNPGLTSVARFASTTGWGATWSGKRVVIATRATATTKPTITGTVRIGRTMTAKTGTWRGTPAPTFRYQWYACTKAVTAPRSTVPSTCTAITGATRSTFKLTSAQRNKYVAVRVTGTSLGTTATTWLSKTTTKVR